MNRWPGWLLRARTVLLASVCGAATVWVCIRYFGRRGVGRQVLRWAMVTTLASGLLTSAGGCGSLDPRAYPGSDGRSFERALRDFSLPAPACALGNLRYYADTDIFGGETLEFRVEVTSTCAHEYVTKLGIDDSPPYFGRPFLGTPEERKFGWKWTGPRPTPSLAHLLATPARVR